MRYLRVGLEYKQEIYFGYTYTLYTQKVISYFFYVFVFDDKPVIGLYSTKWTGSLSEQAETLTLLSSVVAHAYNSSIQEAEVMLQ